MTAELQKALSAKGLSVQSIPGKGRGLVTTTDFSPGDVIICEQPYSSAQNKLLGGSSCDGCFATGSLRKCSACHIARYCGSMCQKSEWKIHQLECQALARLSEDRRKMLTPTIRLIVRIILKRRLQNQQAIPSTPTDNFELVDALVSHISDTDENQLVMYAQMANLVKLVLPSSDVDLKETTQIFSKVACNAHTICDSELRPLGTGLYPIISIINHSCVPNAVLVFEGRVAFVRAVEPIARGTELSISYIETAATTDMRQKDLKQYLFSCTCSRCIKDHQEDAILNGYRCKDKKCSGFLLQDSEKKHFTCQQCGSAREQQEINKIECEAQEILKRAASLLSSDNYHDASVMYKNVEHLQLKVCHSFSIDLLRIRETLLKIMMVLNDWSSALTYCRLTIPIYHRIYPRIHPMLGLQYYTCGKLEWLLELTEDALKSFTKAMDILRITHGTDTPFMRELSNKLDEARDEALYKSSSHG